MIEIDPTLELSLALHSRSGVYALLIGSGISSGAGIPTGWAVLRDLIEQIAVADGSKTSGQPERWYTEKYKAAPNYSEVIELSASTPAERQQLIRPYFEPDEGSEDPDLKQPTKAHIAIARMMKAGAIRLVLTTNFDRLLEQACEREGVVPIVVSDEHAVSGMIPIQHTTSPIIMKLHGDYLDTRLRNTESEIGDAYPEPIANLLERVFDEFGLIVCGWSAEWDHALRDAIMRAPGRRFTTYWIDPGSQSDAAKELIKHRDARVLKSTADEVFPKLVSQLQSLADMQTLDPVSSQLAVAQVKRHIDARANVKLHDLIFREADRVRVFCDGKDMTWSVQPSSEAFIERSYQMVGSCSSLVPMLSAIAHHDSDFAGTLILPLLDLLQQRVKYENQIFNIWRNLALLPTVLSVYALGIGFLRESRYDLIAKLLNEPQCFILFRGIGKDKLAPYSGWQNIFDYDLAQEFHDKKKQVPGAEFAWSQLLPMLVPIFYNEQFIEKYYDELEVMIACKGGGAGRWIWKKDAWSGEESVVARIQEEIRSSDSQHVWITEGVFSSVADLNDSLERLAKAT